jgi:hypothetical protein
MIRLLIVAAAVVVAAFIAGVVVAVASDSGFYSDAYNEGYRDALDNEGGA